MAPIARSCPSCGAPTVKAYTTTGLSLTVDLAPHPDGTVELVTEDAVPTAIIHDDQLDLLGNPRHRFHRDTCQGKAVARARRRDPETSHEAAASQTSAQIRSSQREVLALLESCGPMTDHRISETAVARGIRQSPSGLRTRRAELVEQGKVTWSGAWERLPSRRRARVWQVAR